MLALKRVVTAAISLLGYASAQDPDENIKWSDFVCQLSEYENSCVRCIYENGEFYSNDGEKGICILKKVRQTRSFVDIRKIGFKCDDLKQKGMDLYNADPECTDPMKLELDETYVGNCLETRLNKLKIKDYTSKASSFDRCKGSNWRPRCDTNPADCKFQCRDFDIKKKEQDINGNKIPCQKDGMETRIDYVEKKMRNDKGETVIVVDEVKKIVCGTKEAWSSFNHTIMLPPKQACALTIKNSWVPANEPVKSDDGKVYVPAEKPWPVGFQFAENEGVAVIIQETEEGADFWDKDKWNLLVNGKVPVQQEKEWHIILVNTKNSNDDDKNAYINLRYGQAASLALSLMTTAMLFVLAN